MGEAVAIIDLGSTRAKCTLFSPDGRVLAHASASYPTATPRPTWAEQDPRHWWEAGIAATRQAMAMVGDGARGRGGEVLAIGVTGQMHGLVALDNAGQPLGPCLTVQDRRAAPELAAIEAELGEGRAYTITGARLDAASPAAKLRWLARHQPQAIRDATLLLPPKDYLRYRLTGEAATEPIDAAGTLLYDIRGGAWSGEMAAAACIEVAQLPTIQPGTSLAGTLTLGAAEALGLPAGIPVAIGAGDDVECLGAGLLGPGRALEHLGTTGSILACSPRIVIDPAARVDCYPHAVPGLYLVGGSTGSAGSTLAWAARHLAAPEGSVPAGRDPATLWLGDDPKFDGGETVIFLPYLSGERCPVWDPDGRGLLVGMTLGTTGRDITHAVFAGVAFSLRHILDTLVEMGIVVDDLVASGDDGTVSGMAWPLLRSAVYGRPLRLPTAGDSTSLGALILTLVAIGLQPDVSTAAARLVPTARAVQPDAIPAAEIARRYALYRAMSAAALPLFRGWGP